MKPLLDDVTGAALVAGYLRAVCEPLLDAEQVPTLVVESVATFPGEFCFRVLVGCGGGGFLVGKGGCVADAIRMLARSRARTIGWDARVDVRISRAD